MSTYQQRLDQYYIDKRIHPLQFNCPNKNFCKQYACNGNMTEAKMSMVGSRYGEKYPKIVVVSLDPPSGKDINQITKNWDFSETRKRTTQFVSSTHEMDNYLIDRPNPHWAMTQIIVKDLITLWGYKAQANAAIVMESYSGRPIENVSAYFSHVNVAKCSMNNDGQRQAPEEVHLRCSHYLLDELSMLEPHILITQGATTNKILGKKLIGREISNSDLPCNRLINLRNRNVLWLPMHHPTQQINKIRAIWSAYSQAVQQCVQKRV